MKIIDEVPKDDWQIYEQYWISQFKCWGFNLTNLSIGGDGATGYKMTEEQKEKLRKPKSTTINMRKPKSEEHKRKISEVQKGKKLSKKTIKKLKKSHQNNPNVIKANRNIAKNNEINVYQYDKHMILVNKWTSFKEAALFNGLHPGHISECVNDKRKTTGGCFWLKEEIQYKSTFLLKEIKQKINKLWIEEKAILNNLDIINLISNYFNVSTKEIYIKDTTKQESLIPKYYTVYIMYNLFNLKYSEIDKLLKTKGTSMYKNKYELNNDILIQISKKIERNLL